MQHILDIAMAARNAAHETGLLSTERKNALLSAIADALEANSSEILAANAKDLAAAKQKGVTDAMADRLMLNHERIAGMAQGVRKVVALPDPIGETVDSWTLHNGLDIRKVRVPLGVIGIIYEARPNVTSDAVALCLKAGNAAVLRGGSEAINSNRAVMAAIRGAISAAGANPDCAVLIDDTTREGVDYMMTLNGVIDVLIPRGGAGLISSVVQHSTIPVIETGTGICHIFVDDSADLDMAAEIVFNAKTSRPAVCNAAECMLVHESIAEPFLHKAHDKLAQKSVQLRGDAAACAVLTDAVSAGDADYDTEFKDFIMAVKVVSGIDEAIAHINKHGTHHSDAIVTRSDANARKFQNEVDSACVYVNASTRFTDGEEFGFGAEIGISTQKLHARGPMGLRELTTYKYTIDGNGQVR